MTDNPEATPLAENLRRLADTGHADAAALRDAADVFDQKSDQFARGEIGTPQFLGIWAKTRKLYTEAAGKGIMES